MNHSEPLKQRLFRGRLRPVRELLRHLKRTHHGYMPVYLSYPVEFRPRWGWGQPPLEEVLQEIEKNREQYATLLGKLSGFADKLAAIPILEPADDKSPYWMNGWVQGLDPVSLYGFPCIFQSQVYIEIGSGNSTKFVRKSIEDNNLNLKILSIDPRPRAEIDQLCDEIMRSPVERVDLSIFDQLKKNDILMIDNSHRCFQNSDVTAVFLEILPRLNPGVLVYIDDIYLPHDYPPELADFALSEQYLLAVLLVADRQRRYEIIFPGYFFFIDPDLRQLADSFWSRIGMAGLSTTLSNGFWIRTR